MNRLLSVVLLISLYASGALSSKCAESTCPLFADGVTEWELTLFPVPTDCTQYIMCQRGQKHYRPCPEGLHFNSVLNVCDWPRDAQCTECVEEIIEECAEPKECPTIEDGVTEWDLTLLPVPADCTKFIMCQRGFRHLMDCPANLHFNPILDVCDYPENAGCTGCGTPGTDKPTTEAPETEAPETEAPETEAPETEAPETETPETEAPETEAPETEAPETEAPETEAPETEAPETEAPETEAPETEAPETCEVSCGDGDATSAFNIGNPLDCSRYYMCFNNRPISMACPRGLNYDTIEKICKLPKYANCASCETEVTEAPTTTTEAAPETEAPETCEVSCGDGDATSAFNIGNPLDCSRYYMCFNNRPISMACPRGLNYDTKEQICKLPKYANCASCETEVTDAPTTTTEAITTTEATTTTTEATTTTTEATPTEAPVDKCQTPVCPADKGLVLLPVPSNCNQFVSCIYGFPTVVNCPDSLYFSARSSYCTLPILSGCKNCKN